MPLVRDKSIYETIVVGSDPEDLDKWSVEKLIAFATDPDSDAQDAAASYLKRHGFIEYELKTSWEDLVDRGLAERRIRKTPS